MAGMVDGVSVVLGENLAAVEIELVASETDSGGSSVEVIKVVVLIVGRVGKNPEGVGQQN